MYQSSYADILADSATSSRDDERRALDHAIELLDRAKATPPHSPAEREATLFVLQLWGTLVSSLASADNDLPKPLRAGLMSVGLGVMAEALRINNGESRDIEGISAICGIIRDGLA